MLRYLARLALIGILGCASGPKPGTLEFYRDSCANLPEKPDKNDPDVKREIGNCSVFAKYRLYWARTNEALLAFALAYTNMTARYLMENEHILADSMRGELTAPPKGKSCSEIRTETLESIAGFRVKLPAAETELESDARLAGLKEYKKQKVDVHRQLGELERGIRSFECRY